MTAALFVAAVAGRALPASAQRFHGVLRDSNTGEPVSGAVVWLTGAQEKFLARTVSRDSGLFVIPRFQQARELHVIRIGYRPLVTALALDADSVLTLRITAIPLLLHAVASNGKRLCPGDAADTVALDLWNQARAALLAGVVAREAAPPRIRVYSYTQTLDPVRKHVVADSSTIKDFLADKPYVAARPGWVFADQGYIQDEPGGDRTYYAPDDGVMLDTTFIETHCLHVVDGDATHANQVGIGFEPTHADGRDTLVDIKGVLWLDARAPRLRSIEFTYTGLEPAASGSGGDITFENEHGVPMISRWQIRSAALVDEETPSPNGVRRRPPPRAERDNYNVLNYRRSGGQLISASWDDGSEVHESLPRVVGQVVDTAGKPVAGIRVWARETHDTTVTDSSGKFHLPYTKPGSYVVVASDSLLATQGIARTVPSEQLLFGQHDFETKLVLYPRDAVLRLICPPGAYRPNTGTALVHVTDAQGNPVSDARVWVGAAPPSGVTQANDSRGSADPQGRFSVCGASLDHPLEIHAAKGGIVGDAVISQWTAPLMVLEIRLAGRR